MARGRARSASAHPQALYRLLRALASIGVVAAVAPGPDGSVDQWELTELGRALREDAPDSQRAWVLTMGEFAYPVWGELLHSVRTGTPGFERVFGQSYYEYMAAHPPRSSEIPGSPVAVALRRLRLERHAANHVSPTAPKARTPAKWVRYRACVASGAWPVRSTRWRP